MAGDIGCDGSGGDLSLGRLCLCLPLSLRGRCIICASVCLRVCVGARLCRCVSVCRCVCMSACARWCVGIDSTVVIVDGGQSQRQLTTASVVSVNETTDNERRPRNNMTVNGVEPMAVAAAVAPPLAAAWWC